MAAVCLSGVTTQALSSMSNERSGGCHGRGHQNPVPSPVNYSCCLTGHDHAIVTTSFALPSLQTTTATATLELMAQVSSVPVLESQKVSSGDPPLILPLRI